LALINPTPALKQYKQNIAQISPINFGDLIDNNAFNIHWMEVLQAYGKVDTSVTADTIDYSVFNKGTAQAPVRTFVAYNPTAFAQDVHFKIPDPLNPGQFITLKVTVAPHSTGVFDKDGKTLAQQTDPNYALKTPQSRFFFTSANGLPTLTYGQTGTGELPFADALTVPTNGMLKFTISGH
jgi:hypothetical protein